MLQSDWLSHCALSALVYAVAWRGRQNCNFPHFSDVLRKLKEGDSRFLELKNLDFFKKLINARTLFQANVFLQLDDTGSTGKTIHRRTREEKTISRQV